MKKLYKNLYVWSMSGDGPVSEQLTLKQVRHGLIRYARTKSGKSRAVNAGATTYVCDPLHDQWWQYSDSTKGAGTSGFKDNDAICALIAQALRGSKNLEPNFCVDSWLTKGPEKKNASLIRAGISS